jgi:hypothetical protein
MLIGSASNEYIQAIHFSGCGCNVSQVRALLIAQEGLDVYIAAKGARG